MSQKGSEHHHEKGECWRGHVHNRRARAERGLKAEAMTADPDRSLAVLEDDELWDGLDRCLAERLAGRTGDGYDTHGNRVIQAAGEAWMRRQRARMAVGLSNVANTAPFYSFRHLP